MKSARSGILLGGGLLVDHVFMIDHFPEHEGTLTLMEEVSKCIGGAPLNVSVTLAKMGVDFPLSIVGKMGDDDNGEFILDVMGKHGIDGQYIQKSPVKTAYTHVLNARNNGQRTFFHELGANALLDIECFDAIDTTHKIFHLGYLLILNALDQPDPEYGSISARLFYDMQQKGYLTSLDLVSSGSPDQFQTLVVPCLPYVNYLVINELEAEMLTGIVTREEGNAIEANIEQALGVILAMGVNDYVVIHAPEGAWARARNDNKMLFVPSYPLAVHEIKGTVGAGDAFCAGTLYGLHQSFSLEKSLKIANACAHFNLHATNSVDGAQPIEKVMGFVGEG